MAENYKCTVPLFLELYIWVKIISISGLPDPIVLVNLNIFLHTQN